MSADKVNKSYAESIRESLEKLIIKKGCCRHAYELGLMLSSRKTDKSEVNNLEEELLVKRHIDIIKSAISGAKCQNCVSHFMRGMFIACGSITDPEKNYHMEFTFRTEKEAEAAKSFLTESFASPGLSLRKKRYVVYYKDSVVIEDILAFIGANAAAFDLMNRKIVNEIRNDTNRQVNCDAANIRKSLEAAANIERIINELQETEFYESMADNLKEAAYLRIKYPQMSLSEIGEKFTVPITKSGVKHRLDKIKEYALSKGIK